MPSTRTTLAALSAMDRDAFTKQLGGIFEHSPWVAERAWAAHPFASVDVLHQAMVQAVRDAEPGTVLTLLQAHPELATPGYLTASSAAEQGGAGLTRLVPGEGAFFAAANRGYQGKFGFPFIIAVRGVRDTDAIRAAMQARLENDPVAEREIALAEVAKIARFRLDDMIET